MTNETAALAGKAIQLISEQLNALQARMVATDLIVAAIMEVHPERAAVLDALERALNPDLAANSNKEDIARAAQERASTLLTLWRKADQEPEQNG